MKKRTYFIGFCKNKRGDTLVIELADNLDDLSPELYTYFGQRETTLKNIVENKNRLLDFAKRKNPRVYGKLSKVRVVRAKQAQTY